MITQETRSIYKTNHSILFWLPRVLTIVLTLFTSILAIDVFFEGYSWSELLVALFMHLVPSLILLIALYISWKYELYGGLFFIALSVFALFAFNMEEDLSNLVLPLIIFAIGDLYIFNWYNMKKLETKA